LRQIVHEAETQRQHARYKLPLKVFFGGKLYKVADWSVGGIGIVGIDDDSEAAIGSVHTFRIIFPFDSFELLLAVEGEIRYVDAAKRRMGVRYVRLTPRQSNVMRYLVDALISGEVVETGDIINVTARKFDAVSRPMPQQAPPKSVLHRARRAVGRAAAYLVMFLAGVGILDFALSGAYERLFTVEARTAAVTGEVVVLAAPVGGQLTLKTKDGAVARGASVFEIADQPGSSVPVTSPCDCFVMKVAASDGTYVRPGDNVVTLVPRSSRQFVSALVDPAQVMRLYPGASVRLQFVDGTIVEPARITRMPPALSANGLATTDLVPVEIDPGRPLTADAIGQPVAVRFNTFDQSWIGHVIASGRQSLARLMSPGGGTELGRL
jgi:alginate biosynthesis protein Alg44